MTAPTTQPIDHKPDPDLDLYFERVVDVPPHLVWRAWTTPEHLVKWFTPEPWVTTECEIDLRPGGAFRTVMRSPEGEEFPNVGCYLEVIENRRLIWTNGLEPGFRPVSPKANASEFDFPFTAIVSMEPAPGGGTRYTALARHATRATKATHEGMGFEHGWGKALDQLVALAKTWERG